MRRKKNRKNGEWQLVTIVVRNASRQVWQWKPVIQKGMK